MLPGRRGRAPRVRTYIRDRAYTTSASQQFTELEELVKSLAGLHHAKVQEERERETGSRTGWTGIIGEAVEQYCDKHKTGVLDKKVSVAVCHTPHQFEKVLEDNPHLVDPRSAKREEVGEDLSETLTRPESSEADKQTALEPSINEATSQFYCDSYRGRRGDGDRQEGYTASDSGECEYNDSQEDESSSKINEDTIPRWASDREDQSQRTGGRGRSRRQYRRKKWDL
jgi:hypothetical protein